MDEEVSCPACESVSCRVIYKVDRVPTNSCILVSERDAAIDFPRANVHLAICNACGFVFNCAFNFNLTTYSSEYEETQAYSLTFNTFHHSLARELIDRYQLHNKSVLDRTFYFVPA